ncbi:MAG: hypothetical protein PVF80_04330, partial [Gammaproteobacteria bacterium]
MTRKQPGNRSTGFRPRGHKQIHSGAARPERPAPSSLLPRLGGVFFGRESVIRINNSVPNPRERMNFFSFSPIFHTPRIHSRHDLKIRGISDVFGNTQAFIGDY